MSRGDKFMAGLEAISISVLQEGAIAELVRARRFDDALSSLYEVREREPHDATIYRAIQIVRDRLLTQGLERLGSLDATPCKRREPTGNLGSDEQYLFDLVRGTASLDELLDASTLGRHRTWCRCSRSGDHSSIAVVSSCLVRTCRVMTTRTVVTPVEEIDLLLRQAEQFYALDLVGEAIARLRHVLLRCKREEGRARDEQAKRELGARKVYTIQMLERLGALSSLGS